jgi:hypothetical protein
MHKGVETFRQALRVTSGGQNNFHAVAAEPGGGQLFYFDNLTVQNTLIGSDNCPDGPESLDASFVYIASGSIYGGANGPGQSATAGEGVNTLSAHRLVCGNISQTPVLGGFRGGLDLCAVAEQRQRGLADEGEVVTLRSEVTELKGEVAELKAMLQSLMKRDDRA